MKRALESESTMNPQIPQSDSDEMRPEYDFSQGVRGKHYRAYRAGTKVVFLEPDIAEAFPTSASVNEALRLLVQLAKTKAVVGSRPDRVVQPSSRTRRKAKSKKRAGAARG